MASRIFDFPEPLSPVMALNWGSQPLTTVRTAYDLNPSIMSSSTFMKGGRKAKNQEMKGFEDQRLEILSDKGIKRCPKHGISTVNCVKVTTRVPQDRDNRKNRENRVNRVKGDKGDNIEIQRFLKSLQIALICRNGSKWVRMGGKKRMVVPVSGV